MVYILADPDIDASFMHVHGKNNQVAELLSPLADSPVDHNCFIISITPLGCQ